MKSLILNQMICKPNSVCTSIYAISTAVIYKMLYKFPSINFFIDFYFGYENWTIFLLILDNLWPKQNIYCIYSITKLIFTPYFNQIISGRKEKKTCNVIAVLHHSKTFNFDKFLSIILARLQRYFATSSLFVLISWSAAFKKLNVSQRLQL